MMKDFKENAMMQEMSLQEIKNVNGGFGPVTWLVLGLLIGECLDTGKGEDFEAGRQAARDFWN